MPNNHALEPTYVLMFHTYLVPTELPDSCEIGDLRLVGGEIESEGTVEVCTSNVWSGASICDDQWDNREAEVVCRQLGYTAKGGLIASHLFTNNILLFLCDCGAQFV